MYNCINQLKCENQNMSSENIATVIKMMESLPETAQEQLVEHLREYIENLRNELEWDGLVQKTQSKLVQAARQARQDIAAGKAKPMDYDQL
jgi:uncharacterized iron-regulated protein